MMPPHDADDFERELQQALARKQPPRDMVAPVMRKIGAAGSAAPRTRRRPWMVPLAVAASLVLSVAGLQIHQYRKAAEARQQLLLALKIASHTLDKVERIAERKLER